MTETGFTSKTLRHILLLLISAALAAFIVVTSATIPLPPTLHRGIFLLAVVYMGLLLYPLPGRLWLIDLLIAICGTISIGFVIWNWEGLAYRINFEMELPELTLALVALATVIEVTRRAVGPSLSIIAIVALLYAYYGASMPEPFTHRGFGMDRLMASQYLTHDGLFSSLLGVASTLVAMFLVFGAVIQQVGVTDLFMRCAAKLSFGAFGGPGKIEVVSSALMGMVSGSSTANVVTTGTATIPMMTKAGFTPRFAAAVEAVSSTGGQIMPPVMGVAAFLMAEVTGIPYATIALAAVVPALLYFVGVFIEVDLESRRLGLTSHWDEASRTRISEILKQSYLLFPLILLTYLLFASYSPTKAAFWAAVSALIVGLPNWRRFIQLENVVAMLADFASAVVTVGLACATAGVVVGVLNMTGTSLLFSYTLVELAGNNVALLLVLVMVLCVILGMGLPTPAAYAVGAAFAAPMLATAGIGLLNAHMFVFFFSCLSSITPPVAVAAYAAAGIAGCSPTGAAITATRLGLGAFLVPFAIAGGNGLLIGQAPALEVVIASTSALLGVAALGVAVIGYYLAPLRLVERLAYGVAAVLLISPSHWLSLVGAVIGAVLLAFHYFEARSVQPANAAESK